MPDHLGRRAFLAGTPALPPAQAAGARSARPGVLLITTDRQSMHALGANGSPHLETPAMDSIAAGGVSFTESYCTCPVCSPAQSSVMTGLMPHETGAMRNVEAIADRIPNLGQHLLAHGYETCYAGKWHLPGGHGEPAGVETLIGGHTLGAQMDEAFNCGFLVSRLSDLRFPGREGRMVRIDRYKFVVFNGGERPGQPFDLDLHPGEVSNLAGGPGAGSMLERHRGLLREWTDRTRDEFRVPAGAA